VEREFVYRCFLEHRTKLTFRRGQTNELGFCFAGAHILSGNVFEPRALSELFPDWKDQDVSISSPCWLHETGC
jgi:hypothetical protein